MILSFPLVRAALTHVLHGAILAPSSTAAGPSTASASVSEPLSAAWFERLLLPDSIELPLSSTSEMLARAAMRTTAAPNPIPQPPMLVPVCAVLPPQLPPACLADVLALVLTVWTHTDLCPATQLPSLHMLQSLPPPLEEAQAALQGLRMALRQTETEASLALSAGVSTTEDSGDTADANTGETTDVNEQLPPCSPPQLAPPVPPVLLPTSIAALTGPVARVVAALGPWGVLYCLGIGRTVGSALTLPPPWRTCMASFLDRHAPTTASPLTKGARAHAKHCHRDGHAFWGRATGSETEKNAQALLALQNIVTDMAWANVHAAPGGLLLFEVRCSPGYGARWLADGSHFRGFLEPQMEDGHAVGWRH